MSRQPLVGFNHSLPYKGRTYHVQTEDSGVEHPHIFSHLFHQGLIIASAKTVYPPQMAAPDVRHAMQQQHKTLMKQLVRGELDARIAQLLGALDADATSPLLEQQQRRIRGYHHQLNHQGRAYSIQTQYYATIVTDIFHERILLSSRLRDCRNQLAPGSDAIRRLAQEQHKELLRQLRDGKLDERIREVLGSVAPQEHRPRLQSPQRSAALERYCHRIPYQDLRLDVQTLLYPPQTPRIITEILHEGQLLTTAEFFDYREVADEENVVDFAREVAQHQHRQVLRQIVEGCFDDLLRLVLGDAFLDALPTLEIKSR